MALDVQMDRINPTTVVVVLNGRLTLGTLLHTAQANIADLIDEGVKVLALDLSGVPYIDSAGLGAIVFLSGKLKHSGGELRIFGAHPTVTSLFTLTHTAPLLKLYPDREAALP